MMTATPATLAMIMYSSEIDSVGGVPPASSTLHKPCKVNKWKKNRTVVYETTSAKFYVARPKRTIETSCRRAAATICPRSSPPRGRLSDLRRRADSNVAAVSHGQHVPTPTAVAAWRANTAVNKAACWPWKWCHPRLRNDLYCVEWDVKL